jgi:hypothetical protein
VLPVYARIGEIEKIGYDMGESGPLGPNPIIQEEFS